MVNKVILIGNLGRDPEVRYTSGGQAVASLRVATSRSWTDKQSGQKKEETEWKKHATPSVIPGWSHVRGHKI